MNKKSKLLITIFLLVIVIISVYVILNFSIKSNNNLVINTYTKRVYQETMETIQSDKISKQSLNAINNVPIYRNIILNNEASYKTTKVFNIEFKTRWGIPIESEKTKKSTQIKELSYKDGPSLMITFSTTTNPKNLLIDEYGIDYEKKFENILGDRINSEYEYLNYIYSSSPDRLLKETSKEVVDAMAMGIILKSTMLFSNLQIYKFSTPTIKGLYFGEYPQPDHSGKISIFDINGNLYEILTNGKYNILQSDIDTIISTFKTNI